MKKTHCSDVPEIKLQHRGILDIADEVTELVSTHEVSKSPEIFNKLKIFESALRGHIEFENKNFYDKLFKDMWDDGENTQDLENFIKEMKHIAEVIFTFLAKYESSTDIERDIHSFSKNFGRILGILMLRIEAEESSKYITDC